MIKNFSASLTLALTLTTLAACQREAAREDATTEPERTVRTVRTATVRSTVLRDTVRLTAEALPWSAVTVAAEISGRIVELPAEVGDAVREGDVVARLDDATVRAERDRAEARARSARAALVQAERDLERGAKLAQTQDISAGELDRLTLARDTAAAELQAAEAQSELNRQNVERAVVTAPFAGVVSERHVEVGSWVSPGSPLVRLVETRRLKVRASASQRDRARLKTGLPAEVRAEALPGAPFQGRVRLLGQEADPGTGTYLVEVAVEEPASGDGRLLPGMQGTVVILLGERTALVVPRSALVTVGDADAVFVAADGTARLVRPERGATSEDEVEILAGLKEDDEVVVAGQHVLQDGDPIRKES